MSKPTPLSGFPELLPEQRVVERAIIASLTETFERHGFAGIETRAVEPLDRLAKGGEVDKEIYVLRRLQADDAGSDSGLGLHFDLTVPFARYVLENAGHLEFPFRRYQVQPAWRGERPQEGRYRQFTQADIDVVGQGELGFHHDVEVVRVMVEALGALPLPGLTFCVNNRKLIQGFYAGLGIPDVTAAIRVIDKLDKLPREQVAALLGERAGASDQQAQQCLELATIRTGDPAEVVDRVRALGVVDDLLDTGLAELVAVLEGCASVVDEHVRVVADLRIARGLDYYTGTVLEVFMDGYERLKSVGGGGRYDALASDGRTTYPGVGVSFGVSRTLVPLLADGVLRGSRKVPSAVLVALTDEASRGTSDAVAARLRARGIACEVAASPQRFGKQIRTAERRGIPFVWFPGVAGALDEVKDIRSGEQAAADADAWTPPEADRRPSVVSTSSTTEGSADRRPSVVSTSSTTEGSADRRPSVVSTSSTTEGSADRRPSVVSTSSTTEGSADRRPSVVSTSSTTEGSADRRPSVVSTSSTTEGSADRRPSVVSTSSTTEADRRPSVVSTSSTTEGSADRRPSVVSTSSTTEGSADRRPSVVSTSSTTEGSAASSVVEPVETSPVVELVETEGSTESETTQKKEQQ